MLGGGAESQHDKEEDQASHLIAATAEGAENDLVVLLINILLVDVVPTCMEVVPEGADDKAILAALMNERETSDLSVIDIVRRQRNSLPTSIWLSITAALLYNWEERGDLAARNLAPIEGDTPDDATPAHLIAATNSLRTAVAGISEVASGVAFNRHSRALAIALKNLSSFMEGMGKKETAYDLINVAPAFLADEDPLLGEIASEGLRLAFHGGKPAQICVMSIMAAIAAIAKTTGPPGETAKATEDAGLRLAAYAASEIAIERIALSPLHVRSSMAERLSPALESRPWLKHLRVRMVPFLLNEGGMAKVRDALGGRDFPTRVANISATDWWTRAEPVFHLMRGEIDFENERLALIKRLKPVQITTDAIDWTFELPDYMHALPHSGSLLKEKNFPEKLGLLVHEITHVLTFLGGLGAALMALRVAGIQVASELWRTPVDATEEEIAADFRARKGIASLEPNDATLLLSAERQLDLRLKSQLLLDIWTAWTEGVAVFGELGADPELDEVGINPVLECLRNLVDIFADSEIPGDFSDKLRAHGEDFERQCSAALRQTGRDRLGGFLRGGDREYLHGYLVVRAIASRWRLQIGRNLTSAQCFDVFLHATRFGVYEFLPDLALPHESFAAKAEEGLRAFVEALANLSAFELETYLRRESPNAPGQRIGWAKGQVRALDAAEVESQIDMRAAMSRRLLERALRSLTTVEAAKRLESFELESATVASALTEVVESILERRLDGSDLVGDLLEIFEDLFEVGMILPIGKCSSPFFLNIDEATNCAQICLNLRTAEALKDSGKPSYNGYWFPLDGELGKKLRASYELHAIPRLDVTRVIVLSELDLGLVRIKFPHIFALQYRDWFAMHGTSQWAQKIEDLNKPAWEGLTKLVERRLDANEIKVIERRFIASGNEAINRTLEWLDQSKAWRLGDSPVSIGDFAAHLKRIAQRLLDDSSRESARRRGVTAIISAIRASDEHAEKAAAMNFRNILGTKTGLSEDLVGALYETARRAGDSDFLDRDAGHFRIGGLPLLEKDQFGWDVRPAVVEEVKP